MTAIPETRCLKMLCKFSFVAIKIRDVTKHCKSSYNKLLFYFEKSYKKPYESIWLQINSYQVNLKKKFLSFRLP